MHSTAGSALHPFESLTPDLVLDALDSVGLRGDGRLTALSSYENRVYQVQLEDGAPVVAKFYRPERWSDAQIQEEHDFAAELMAAEIPVVGPMVLSGQFAAGPPQGEFAPSGGSDPRSGGAWGLHLLMLWIKALHIVFIASWFAGLFYLPRIFVNLAMVPAGSDAERARLLLMARKLLRFTTLLAGPALGLGLYLWLGYGIGMGPGSGWMHAKLMLVLLVIGYHHGCSVMLRKLEAGISQRSHVFYRWFNEIPVLLLTAIVILVVVKPF